MKVKHELTPVTSPSSLASALTEIFAGQHPFDQAKEQFFAIGMNAKHVIQYIDMVTMGVLDASLVHPRETFRHAIAQGVSCIALAHNHPTAKLEPSKEDIAVTKQLVLVGKILGIEVLDHIIFASGSGDFNSLREHGHSNLWNQSTDSFNLKALPQPDCQPQPADRTTSQFKPAGPYRQLDLF